MRSSIEEFLDRKPTIQELSEWEIEHVHKFRKKKLKPKKKKNAVCWICGIDLGKEYGITCKDHENHPFLDQVEFEVIEK